MSKPSTKASAAKVGALGFMAVALGCAGFAAYLIGDMMSSSYSGTKVVPVVVAASDLRAGEPIRPEALAVKEWPEDAAPAGSFATVEALVAAHENATPTVGILAGEPVVSSRMSSSKSGTGIASLIRKNMRAVALQVDDSVGFTGLVYPGAYVDIIATIRDPLGRGPSSRIAVQNARVLSLGMDADVATRRVREDKVDKLTGTSSQGGTFVTLEVTPDEAEVLAIARAEGKIDMVLRNATDDEIVDTGGATPNKFSAFAPDVIATNEAALNGTTPVPAAAAKPEARGVKVTRSRRQIQIVAHDEADRPSATATSGRIEMYNAN
jgi:pilus assembly protein CpaB